MKLLHRKFTLMIVAALAICLFNLPLYANILTEPVIAFREEILQGPYGQMPAEELVSLAIETRSPERQDMRIAMVIRKAEVLPVIKEKLQTGSLNEKHELLTLIQNQLRWPETVSYIEPMVRDDSLPEQIRGRAARALAVFQHHEAIHDIRHLLTSSENIVAKLLAARAIAVLGNSVSRNQFEDMLNDPSPFVQVTAAMCLGMLGSDVGLETAIALSNDEYFGIRRRAAEALSYINTPEALERLYQMREDDQSTSVQDECAAYISEVELSAMQRKDALKQLKEMFDPDNFSASQWAFMYMVNYFGIEAIDVLQKLAETEGPFQRAAMITLLEIDSGTITLPEIRRKNK